MPRRVIILGSTGSIGTQALDVIAHVQRHQPEHGLEVVGLAAHSNAASLFEQAARLGVRDVAITKPADGAPDTLRIRTGENAAERLIREVDADIILAAMVGVAGLPATLAAIDLGRDVALANKETLVAAGALVVPRAKARGVSILPVDSEHAALWLCMVGERGALNAAPAPPLACPEHVSRVVLTASGGPFRTATREATANATAAEALNHPTWRMGRKVTVDSASLMNKALEVIEAHWLFDLPADRIDVLVHPQSIVHAMVEFVDGSLLAQLAAPDMRLPIHQALLWPRRVSGVAKRLNLAALRELTFEPPDVERFPALSMAAEVIRAGGTAGAIFNAANEAAVEAFLAEGSPLRFGAIAPLVREALDTVPAAPLDSLQCVLDAGRAARRCVQARLHRSFPGAAV